MKRKNLMSKEKVENRILPLEMQLSLAQDRNDTLSKQILDLNRKFELAMKRIDYLESVIQQINTLIFEDISRKLQN